MLARNETLLKWTAYAAVTFLCFFVQGAILQRVTILGVMPFLYPMMAGILAVFEGPLRGVAYSLALGVFCDLLLSAPLPCFYTLILPLVGLVCGAVATGLLSAGFPCSLAAVGISFLMVDAFHCLFLTIGGTSAWQTGMLLAAREIAASVLFSLPLFFLFRSVFRKFHAND